MCCHSSFYLHISITLAASLLSLSSNVCFTSLRHGKIEFNNYKPPHNIAELVNERKCKHVCSHELINYGHTYLWTIYANVLIIHNYNTFWISCLVCYTRYSLGCTQTRQHCLTTSLPDNLMVFLSHNKVLLMLYL